METKKESKKENRKESAREGLKEDVLEPPKSPRQPRKKSRTSYDDKRALRMFRAGQGNSGGRLSEGQSNALGFMHRLEDETSMDESSRHDEDSTTLLDDDVGFEAEVVNDVFWRVHGNKCMTLRFNQDVVSRLTKAAQAEVGREEKAPSSRMFPAHSAEDESNKGMMAYICGSPGFDDSVRDMLIESGLSKENITNFYASPSVHL